MNEKSPQKLILKNSSLKVEDVIIIIAIIIGIVSSLKSLVGFTALILAVGLIIILTKIVKRIKNQEPQIIIDENGIEFYTEKIKVKWEKIEYAFIQSESDSKHSIKYFHIITKNEKYSKIIDDVKYSEVEVISAIEYFSGRDIGEVSDKFRDEIIKILGSKNNVHKIMHEFSKSKNRQMIISFFLFFTIVGFSIFIQLKKDINYSIGYGFILSIIVLLFYGKYEDNLLRQNYQLSYLTDEQFDSLAIKYQMRFPKKQQIGFGIFFSFIAIAIFFISYLLR